jgi:hypothetical protein
MEAVVLELRPFRGLAYVVAGSLSIIALVLVVRGEVILYAINRHFFVYAQTCVYAEKYCLHTLAHVTTG